MEVVAANALKPSLRTEFVISQVIRDEILCFNAKNIVVCEDFSVDDLLDFSNSEEIEEYEDEEDEEKNSNSGSLQLQDRTEDDNNSNSTAGDSDSVFAGELSVPEDDVADLEWVSHFVDDSLPELSLLYPVGSDETVIWAEPEPRPGSDQAQTQTQTHSPIPRKPRTGKTRKANARVCSFTLSPLFKKQKKKAEAQGGAQFQRRCSHCQVQKTPQWRTGPLGPKTLCNACGVRFKSGRLFPEYRPACSPTFSGEIHSNSHRKVLEMRRRKEMDAPAEPAEPVTGSDQTQLVSGC